MKRDSGPEPFADLPIRLQPRASRSEIVGTQGKGGKVLFLFLDGVGIGSPDPDRNPFLQAELPHLRRILGGRIPTLDDPEVASPPPSIPASSTGSVHPPVSAGLPAIAFPLDPNLGVQGLPQSGTGHTALFTGRNAPRLFGRHFGPWVPARLRPLLEAQSLLIRARRGGLACQFANAYPKGYEQSRWARRPAGAPLMARMAGLLVRDEEDLARGDALASEIVNTGWRTHLGHGDVPEITPQQAGRNLARIASVADLTFFAHYGTDHAGHEGLMTASIAALERVDAFLGGLLTDLPPRTLLVLASDHGNIEEVGVRHTSNPALTLLAGPDAMEIRRGLASITDLTPAILRHLRCQR